MSGKIWIQSSDGAKMALDKPVAERSVLIKNLIDDLGDGGINEENPIPIPNVRASLLLLPLTAG